MAQAFDERVAVALVGSSGQGGVKLHRHDYGEAVENLTAPGEYHWMAGNFLKYGTEAQKREFLPKLANPEQRYASCPVQLIVPRFDNYASHNLYSDLSQWVPELYRRDIDATHWVVLSHHALIAQWITEFISACELGEQDSLFAHLRANPSEAA